jgi:hypothetical protein
MENGRYFIETLIAKDSRLPAHGQKVYRAGPGARVEVYEGESSNPDECVFRGLIERLANEDGSVTIRMDADTDGVLRVTAEYPPDRQDVIELKNELYMYDARALPLRTHVQSALINL